MTALSVHNSLLCEINMRVIFIWQSTVWDKISRILGKFKIQNRISTHDWECDQVTSGRDISCPCHFYGLEGLKFSGLCPIQKIYHQYIGIIWNRRLQLLLWLDVSLHQVKRRQNVSTTFHIYVLGAQRGLFSVARH